MSENYLRNTCCSYWKYCKVKSIGKSWVSWHHGICRMEYVGCHLLKKLQQRTAIHLRPNAFPFLTVLKVFVHLWFGVGFCLYTPHSVSAHLTLYSQSGIYSAHNWYGSGNMGLVCISYPPYIVSSKRVSPSHRNSGLKASDRANHSSNPSPHGILKINLQLDIYTHPVWYVIWYISKHIFGCFYSFQNLIFS